MLMQTERTYNSINMFYSITILGHSPSLKVKVMPIVEECEVYYDMSSKIVLFRKDVLPE